MKDIKELIYAAVEENAVKFQELVNAQLQVRAYDAIEALRPEIGASMFGESSHMKGKDDEDEEMEGDEDEDEEEMDDKKKSMKEALHPNQQKIDVVDDEKIDAKDFAKLRKMKKGNVQENVREYLNQKGTGKSAEGYADAGTFDRQTAEKHAAKHGGKVVPDPSGKHLVKLPGARTGQSGKTAVANFIKNRKGDGDGEVRTEEVEQIDETSLKRANDYIAAAQHRLYNPASTKTSPQRAAKLEKGIERAHKSGGGHVVLVHKAHTGNLQKTVDALKQSHGGNGQHPITVHPPSGKYGPDHAEIHIPRSSSTGRNIESVKHTLSRANDGKPVTAAVVHHDTGEMHRIGEEVEQIHEVAMPKNAADWQAMINHQIQIAGHPVATDAQFRATTVGKDMSKIASLEPGEDMLQYATAQGGTVKK
jgi:hypothetical protein